MYIYKEKIIMIIVFKEYYIYIRCMIYKWLFSNVIL